MRRFKAEMLCAVRSMTGTFHQRPELNDYVDDEMAGLVWIRFHGWIKRPDL